MLIQCTSCKIEKNQTDFSFRSKKQNLRDKRCKDCKSKYTKQHYIKNKKSYIKRAVDAKRKQIEAHCKRLIEYLKQHSCADCGEKDIIVLQFDHVLGKKVGSVFQMVYEGYGWEKIMTEIKKCEIRCANCHTRKTAKQFGWKYKIADTGVEPVITSL